MVIIINVRYLGRWKGWKVGTLYRGRTTQGGVNDTPCISIRYHNRSTIRVRSCMERERERERERGREREREVNKQVYSAKRTSVAELVNYN